MLQARTSWNTGALEHCCFGGHAFHLMHATLLPRLLAPTWTPTSSRCARACSCRKKVVANWRKMSKRVKSKQTWVKVESKSQPGQFYYFDKESGKCSWEAPPEFEENSKTVVSVHIIYPLNLCVCLFDDHTCGHSVDHTCASW